MYFLSSENITNKVGYQELDRTKILADVWEPFRKVLWSIEVLFN